MIFHVYRKTDRKWEIVFGRTFEEIARNLKNRNSTFLHSETKQELIKHFDIFPIQSEQHQL